ncbi:MAG: hypothetical protein J5916_06875 [Oscillospiraceae bacterium]|nr:hypothetical protein [Oscillospiraceae bacterium]
MRMKTQRILAALLSLVLLLALAPAGWAEGGDGEGGAIPEFLKTPNTVVINLTPGTDEEFNKEIVNASVQADLYLITEATPVKGYDTYEYKKLEGDFASFQTALDDALETNPSDPDEMASEIATQPLREASMLDRFTSLAYDIAEVVLADDFSAVTPISFKAEKGASTFAAGGLKAGLYLLVLRGSNLTDKHLMLPEDAEKEEDKEDYGYVTETEKKLSDYGPDGTVTKIKHIATRAFSDKYEFLFEPQLITVPTRVDEKTQTVLQYNTAYGVWSNELDLNIKAAKEDRKGKIKVKKTLSDYLDLSKDETFEPAMFTFDVVATKTDKRDSEELYRKQVSINIEGPDNVGKIEVLKDLPVGSYAWVTETYQGAHYQVNMQKNTGPFEVKADKLVVSEKGVTAIEEQPAADITAEFDNVNNDTHRGGHGIENVFTYDGKTWSNNGETGPKGWTTEPADAEKGGAV